MTFTRIKGSTQTDSLVASIVAAKEEQAREVKRLLLVDDEPLGTEFVATMVAREFYGEVVVASSVKEARGKLERDTFQAAILDYSLSNGLGIELYADIKIRWPEMKVIFLTGYDFPQVRRSIEAIGTARIHSKEALTSLEFTRELLEGVGLRRREPTPLAEGDGI